MTKTIKSLFLRNTEKDESGCLIWKGAKNPDTGYGVLTIGLEYMLAHRVAFELFNGEIIPGNYICHKCDNPACVNPEHLFQGSAQENSLDCCKKGRAKRRRKRGVRLAFTPEQIRAIRKDTRKQVVIAREYGVTPACICYIKKYISYGHVKDDEH